MAADHDPHLMQLRLREQLTHRESLNALLVKMPGSAQIEIAALAGLDFVVVDTEHGAGDAIELENHLRAADSVGLPVLVRIPAADASQVLTALDSGAAGIVFPHVSSPAAAQLAVQTAHYPPLGHRSLSLSSRGSRYGAISVSEHLRRSAETTSVVVQVEDPSGVKLAHEIASVPGVNAIFVGLTDLALSIGVAGDPLSQKLAASLSQVRSAAARSGIPVMIVASSPTEAQTRRSSGIEIILFVASQLIFASFAGAAGKAKADVAEPGRRAQDTIQRER